MKSDALNGNTEHIPENNIARLRGLGLEVVKKITGADCGEGFTNYF